MFLSKLSCFVADEMSASVFICWPCGSCWPLTSYWDTAVRGNKILRAVDGIFAAVRREHGEYHRQFGVAPTFRIGIHGGDVVVSEQGDTKRAIGVYGDPINIAARMEEAAALSREAWWKSQRTPGDQRQVIPAARGDFTSRARRGWRCLAFAVAPLTPQRSRRAYQPLAVGAVEARPLARDRCRLHQASTWRRPFV